MRWTFQVRHRMSSRRRCSLSYSRPSGWSRHPPCSRPCSSRLSRRRSRPCSSNPSSSRSYSPPRNRNISSRRMWSRPSRQPPRNRSLPCSRTLCSRSRARTRSRQRPKASRSIPTSCSSMQMPTPTPRNRLPKEWNPVLSSKSTASRRHSCRATRLCKDPGRCHADRGAEQSTGHQPYSAGCHVSGAKAAAGHALR